MTTETKQIISGVKWTSIQFTLNTVFRFGVKLLLAKLLLPNDFGLVAMASIFIAVTEAASELGMGAALIQKRTNDEAIPLYSTAYWSGLVWGLGLYLIMAFAIGPFAAYFYEEPLLKILLPILSIGVLVKPLNLIHTVILTRKMDFKKLAIISNISALIAGIISLILALVGIGVWALVVYNVLAILLTVPMMFFITKWKPYYEWSSQYFKDIFGFGAFSTGTVVLSTITYNIDNLFIGKLLGAKLLGSYTLAFSLTEQLRMTISSVLNKVMYPVFGKNQNDKALLNKYFLKIININAIVIYPLMMFLVLFSKELILGFFGEDWEDAIIPLRILAVAVMIHLIVNSFTAIIRGLGKPQLEMKIILFLTLFLLIPGLYLGISYYGLIGAALAILINKVALAVTGILVLRREISITLLQIFNSLKYPIFSVLISAGLIVFCNQVSVFILVIKMFLFFLLYGILLFLTERKTIKNLIKITS